MNAQHQTLIRNICSVKFLKLKIIHVPQIKHRAHFDWIKCNLRIFGLLHVYLVVYIASILYELIAKAIKGYLKNFTIKIILGYCMQFSD